MCILLIDPLPVEATDNHLIRRCTIKRLDNDILIDEKELWFKFTDQIIPPNDEDCDSYLLSLLMDAMSEERDIIVKGSVSGELLSNLVEYQAIWNKWLPDTYKIINIVVDAIRKDETPVPGAISAFTGGVDGAFSVWRHSQHKNSYRSQKINFCSFVHGFDIPLSNSSAFIQAKNVVTTTLKDIDIELLPIQTNYRIISTLSWEHTHGCALVAALSNFKHTSGTCIIGSSTDYSQQRFPWGSTPVADHLLSSESFKVLHDGSSHSRIEKVKEISEWQMGIDNLRVCWEGDHLDRNCGKCEKCLMTQANFLVIEKPIPNSFPDKDNIKNKLMCLTYAKCSNSINGWISILRYAQKNNIQEEWVDNIEEIVKKHMMIPQGRYQSDKCFSLKVIRYIKKNPAINIVFPLGSQRRIEAVKLLRKVFSSDAK